MKCSLKWFSTMMPIVLVYLALGFQYSECSGFMILCTACTTSLLIIYCGCYFFPDYAAIIVPTLWDYMMNRLKGQEWLYSLSLSSTSLMNVFVGPLLGIVYDKTHACKTLVVIGLFCAATGQFSVPTHIYNDSRFSFLGAFMYFAAVSPYMVIAGRMLQGKCHCDYIPMYCNFCLMLVP